MHKIPVGVLGASGYAGRELCALIDRHPALALAYATANSQRGESAPLPGGGTVTFRAPDDVRLEGARLVFSALPHGTSAEWVARARAAGVQVVDLSSDHRIGGGASAGIPYGLTELRRQEVRTASCVANPGCYPTSALLGLLPLLEGGLLAEGSTVHVNAASGVTGAGLTPRLDLLFGEVSENFRAYGVANSHRHVTEMRALARELGAEADLLFTPHLLPVARGILSTITVSLAEAAPDAPALWRRRFAGEPFIEIVEELPDLRQVRHRNVARIAVRAVPGLRVPTLQIFSAIDNLMKGAAGQAMQNANLMLGLDERTGLPA